MDSIFPTKPFLQVLCFTIYVQQILHIVSFISSAFHLQTLHWWNNVCNNNETVTLGFQEASTMTGKNNFLEKILKSGFLFKIIKVLKSVLKIVGIHERVHNVMLNISS